VIYFTSAITPSRSQTVIEIIVITRFSPSENGTVGGCTGTAGSKSQEKGTEYDYLRTHVHPLSKRLRKNYCSTVEIQWPAHLGQQDNTAQDA